MPSYDFKCSACNHPFTTRSKMADCNVPVESPCPKCGLCRVERLYVVAAEFCTDGINMGRRPVDGGFQEVLAKIHEQTPGSNLNEMLSRNPNRFR